MRLVDVERTYLELRDRDALSGGGAPAGDVTVAREARCAVDTYRALYAGVGRECGWVDRLAWSDEELAAHLARPEVGVWLLREGDRVGGYFELLAHADGSVEIAYFGLLADFHGRGLGKHLLTRAVEEAWTLGASRVWLHTCTLDAPAALPNYVARGFTPYRTERYVAQLPD